LKDARNAQLVVAMETMGAVLTIAGIGVYSFGLYPSQVVYRVVGQEGGPSPAENAKSGTDVLLAAIQARLLVLAGVSVEPSGRERIQILCWRYQQPWVHRLLQSPRAPNLVVLGSADPNSAPMQPAESFLGTRQPNRGEVEEEAEFTVRSEWVSSVEIAGTDEIALEWTEPGWQQVSQLTSDRDGRLILGLSSNRWIDGVVSLSNPIPKRVVFRLRGGDEKFPHAIQAAIRGPDLPAVLELLR
jgi:hypothetical protein